MSLSRFHAQRPWPKLQEIIASGVAPTSHSSPTLPDKSGFNVMKNLPAGPGDFAGPNFDGPISAWNGGGGGGAYCKTYGFA